MSEPLRLACRRTGTGPSLVVIQQLDTKELWQPVIDRLAGEREILGVDLPGFGESPALPGEGRSTIGVLAKAVAAWFDLIRLKRPEIVGCSVGGAVALELARVGAMSRATAIAPVGMWSHSEAAYTVRSVGAARMAARLSPRSLRRRSSMCRCSMILVEWLESSWVRWKRPDVVY
jgi:pimeloyl-ACP methyl ester carboxylesterase